MLRGTGWPVPPLPPVYTHGDVHADAPTVSQCAGPPLQPKQLMALTRVGHAKCQKVTVPCAIEASCIDLSLCKASDTANGAVTFNGHDSLNPPLHADDSANWLRMCIMACTFDM